MALNKYQPSLSWTWQGLGLGLAAVQSAKAQAEVAGVAVAAGWFTWRGGSASATDAPAAATHEMYLKSGGWLLPIPKIC